jgi:hypothetical protein
MRVKLDTNPWASQHVAVARHFVVGCAVLIALVLSGCSRADEVSSLCRRAPELESSLVAVNEGLGNLGATSSAVLQSSFAVLLDTLSVMRELPPREVQGSLDTVERAYREVYVALRNVYWDPSLAESDRNVSLSLANLTRNDNVRAIADLEKFVAERCSGDLYASAPRIDGDATTLPSPVPIVDPPEEYGYVFDDEPSAMASYGYLLANSRGVFPTEIEAQCVGKFVTEAAQVSIFDDDAFGRVVNAAFQVCGVEAFAPESTVTSVG